MIVAGLRAERSIQTKESRTAARAVSLKGPGLPALLPGRTSAQTAYQ